MTKYNAQKTVIDNITFDSKAEGQYYLHLKEKIARKEIWGVELQPEFQLLPPFKKNGKTFREIRYIADFKVGHMDGTIEIVDVKGFETADFKLKRKLFENAYPDFSLTLVKYVEKYGGWIELDEWKRRKKEENK